VGVVAALAAEKIWRVAPSAARTWISLATWASCVPISVLGNVTPTLPLLGHRGVHRLSHGDGILERLLGRLNERHAARKADQVLQGGGSGIVAAATSPKLLVFTVEGWVV